MKNRLILLFAMASIDVVGAAPPPPIEVRAVSVHLFFTPSGELSEDVAAIPGFSSWNFTPVSPVERASSRFESYLIKARLTSKTEGFYKGAVGTVSVLSRRTRKVLYSSVLRGLHIGSEGEAVVARFVEGHVCEPVTVVVAVGSSRVSKDLEFQCGE
jgi:hypothetical protein